jgi:hypothetical protein
MTDKEPMMILVTTYKLKPFLSKAETKEVLAVFAKEGSGPGTLAHYIAADGSHGVVVSDTDDVVGTYRNILNYTQWVEYETSIMLSIEDALPSLAEVFG